MNRLLEQRSLTRLVRPTESLKEERRAKGTSVKERMEGRVIAIETTVEELKAEMRAVIHELQAFGLALGRRTRNQEQSSEGSRDFVNADREWRQESSEDKLDETRGITHF